MKRLTSTSNQTPGSQAKKLSPKSQALTAFFGGVVPVIAFTLIEEKYGVIAGLIAGMTFGCGEIIYELIRHKKVSTITWIGNGLLIVLGAVSLFLSDGLWFKLQPALLEFGLFVFLIGGWFIKKPFLRLLLEKQNPDAPSFVKERMSGMTLRLSLFLLTQSAVATWAAFDWPTEAWALLKSVGLTASTVVFMIAEILWARSKQKKEADFSASFDSNSDV